MKNKSHYNQKDNIANKAADTHTPAHTPSDDETAPEVMDIVDGEDENAELADAINAEQGENAKLRDDIDKINAALEKEKKEYLFLMAEFDNYRKRVVKEKADILKNGAEKVLAGLLPIVDDFERGLNATRNDADAASVREGMELIYTKLVKYLEQNGVKAMESTGASFDPDYHEAIASIPAPDESLKGKVIDTTTKGYMINDKVLRHAKVAVGE